MCDTRGEKLETGIGPDQHAPVRLWVASTFSVLVRGSLQTFVVLYSLRWTPFIAGSPSSRLLPATPAILRIDGRPRRSLE